MTTSAASVRISLHNSCIKIFYIFRLLTYDDLID